jgi:hypothetical protein
MLATLLIPLADSKTIRIVVPTEPAVSDLGAELTEALALIVPVLVLLLFVFFLVRLWRFVWPAPPVVEEDWVLIDGSNVMHWQDNRPSLETIGKVVGLVRASGYVPGVVFDANAGWKLAGRYLHDGDFARLLGLEPRQVLVVAKGTPADPFLLQTAREFGARIVTNDRFRDWAAENPDVLKPGFLIRGKVFGGEIVLEGLAPKHAAPAENAKAR